MSYITTVEFRAIALACDEMHLDLHGVHIVDNGHRIRITTDADTYTVTRYAGGDSASFEAYVMARLEEDFFRVGGVGVHRDGVPVAEIMANVWLDGLLSGSPVRTPLERELGVIYG